MKVNFLKYYSIKLVIVALRLYFERFGLVECVSLVYDPTGRSKGYGFVTFKEPASVEAVLKKIHVIDLRQVSFIYTIESY